jgi:hypothetical protein
VKRGRDLALLCFAGAAIALCCRYPGASTGALMLDSALAVWTAPKDTIWHLAPGAVPDLSGDAVYFADSLPSKPERISGPFPRYPVRLLEAGVQGRVKLAAIIDTAGRIEPRSIRVEETPDSGLTVVSVVALIRSTFRPGRIGGHSVRTLIEIPFYFCVGSCSRLR